MKHLCIIATMLALTLLSCSKNEDAISPDETCTSKPLALSFMKADAEQNFAVSKEMLKEYLVVSKKSSYVTSIKPLTRGDDTLAFYVEYLNGWDIVSADTRIESVLATSDNPIDMASDKTPLEERFGGILDYIESVRESSQRSVSRLWSYIQMRVLSKSVVNTKSQRVARGIVSGMWVEDPDGPQTTSETIVIPHIITVKWGQNNNLWNFFMPMCPATNQKYYVGCGPVAVGEVIHHYRKSNSKNITIPRYAVFSNEMNQYPTFSDFSSCHWDSLAINLYDELERVDYTALFLSYLGQQMGVTLYPKKTSSTYPQIGNALTMYQLDYDYASSYNYTAINNNLRSGKPAIIVSEIYPTAQPDSIDHHAYIIDRYKDINLLTTITYNWVPDYQPTDWELQTLPEWRFNDRADGIERIEVTVSRREDTYFGMNWGYDNSFMDEFYLVHTYTAQSEDDAGIIPSTDRIYTPMWTLRRTVYDTIPYQVKNISSVFYNIRNSN